MADIINQLFVKILEDALSEVKAGRILGGSVLVVDGNGQVAHSTNVGQFEFYTAMIAGAALLQFDLIMTMKQIQAANAARIWRPNMPGSPRPQ